MITAVMLAVLNGISNVANRMVNSQLGLQIGLLQSTFFNYLTGLCTSILVLLIVQEASVPLLIPERLSQLFIYCGGLLGVITVNISSYVTSRLSAFLMTMLVFISQLAGGVLLDWVTRGDISVGKIAGGILVLLGLVCYQFAARRTADA